MRQENLTKGEKRTGIECGHASNHHCLASQRNCVELDVPLWRVSGSTTTSCIGSRTPPAVTPMLVSFREKALVVDLRKGRNKGVLSCRQNLREAPPSGSGKGLSP